MKKITTKGKVKLNGSWDSTMEVFWHPKSDYIMYRDPSHTKYLSPIHEFGRGMLPLEMSIGAAGLVHIETCAGFDKAVLIKKMELYGFVNFIVFEDSIEDSIKFTSDDELAMFQVYFSDFII